MKTLARSLTGRTIEVMADDDYTATPLAPSSDHPNRKVANMRFKSGIPRAGFVIAIALAVLMPAAHAYAASPQTATVAQGSVSGSMTFTFTDHDSWNGGTLRVFDTKADSSSVYVQIKDNWGQQGSNKNCNTGNAGYCTFPGLYYNSGRGTVRYVYLRGCVDSVWTDECSSGAQKLNVFA